ncbi:hypothetical protein GGI12_002198 [Dipsacomyces acuminosporus]|nr:hypothetical protein GGI12_002198 [Dipsacomyces acuminosporus]
MAKHSAMSPKAIANRIKAKGLQRLRWYCQMCEKQCRDQNGFKCHCASESHQRQMAIFAENPERYLELFSQEFEDVFLSILSRRYGTKKTHANQVYQEIVQDRQHLHMNATKWDTLSDFVMYLGREGKCRVEETERGWFIQWVDNSPEALARKEAVLKKERQEMNDEQREQRLLKEQIDRAQRSRQATTNKDAQATERPEATVLKRESAEQPIKLSLRPTADAASTSSTLKPGGKLVFKPKTKPMAAKLVKSNPFKAQSKAEKQTAAAAVSQSKPLSAVEEIMRQDILRKQTEASHTSQNANSSSSSSSRNSEIPGQKRSRSRSPGTRISSKRQVH